MSRKKYKFNSSSEINFRDKVRMKNDRLFR